MEKIHILMDIVCIFAELFAITKWSVTVTLPGRRRWRRRGVEVSTETYCNDATLRHQQFCMSKSV